MRANDLIPNFAIIGNCGLGKVQVCHAWRHLAGGGGGSRPTTRSSKFLNLSCWKGYCYLLIMVPRVGDEQMRSMFFIYYRTYSELLRPRLFVGNHFYHTIFVFKNTNTFLVGYCIENNTNGIENNTNGKNIAWDDRLIGLNINSCPTIYFNINFHVWGNQTVILVWWSWEYLSLRATVVVWSVARGDRVIIW